MTRTARFKDGYLRIKLEVMIGFSDRKNEHDKIIFFKNSVILNIIVSICTQFNGLKSTKNDLKNKVHIIIYMK